MTADELKNWRNSLGYSQTRFAEILNLPMRNIQNWENEVHKVPSLMDNLKLYIDRNAALKAELRLKDREIERLQKLS